MTNIIENIREQIRRVVGKAMAAAVGKGLCLMYPSMR